VKPKPRSQNPAQHPIRRAMTAAARKPPGTGPSAGRRGARRRCRLCAGFHIRERFWAL